MVQGLHMKNNGKGSISEARAGDPIAIARLLVSTPSVNPMLESDGAGELHIAEVAAELLDDWGLTTEFQEVSPGRVNVIARLKGNGPTLMLNGHLDTVGVRGMTVSPFAGDLVGSRIVGRGACDMKGGLASLLAAAARLAEKGPRPNLLVALTADEEHESLGMAEFINTGPKADFAIVCEPTSLAVMPAHKGFIWVTAMFQGRAAHGSRFELGIDAIRHAALYISALDRYEKQLEMKVPHPLLEHGSLHVGTIVGGTAPSVYPGQCEVQLECRTLPGEKGEDIISCLRDILHEVAAEEPTLDGFLEMTLERPGTEVATNSGLVRGLLEAGQAHNVLPRVEGMTAWVDAAFLNQAGIPAVCFGPGSMDQAHTDDEWIEMDEIIRCASVLETFARRLTA